MLRNWVKPGPATNDWQAAVTPEKNQREGWRRKIRNV